MQIILIALLVMIMGGLGALLGQRSPRRASQIGLAGSVLGSLLGLWGTCQTLFTSSLPDTVRQPWSIPFGSFYLEVDALSGFFLLPIFLLTGLAAIYGSRYLNEPKYDRQIGSHWLFYAALSVSMCIVILARNAVLFLIAWEVMALSSFFLVTMENEKESVQKAGWTYLVATHIGTMALFFFFILLGAKAGSLDFDRIAAAGTLIQPQATLFFMLALIGFGTKAGIVPLHVWLPEAHPAAPSHVSAVMSGIMIKTGIYGMMRTLTWLGQPQTGWAITLIVIGCVSGILGILTALAQRDLKRLLAYSSVENIGIIFLGLGLGTLGKASGLTVLTVLGYGGALFHTLNHAIFKSLLFLGGGQRSAWSTDSGFRINRRTDATHAMDWSDILDRSDCHLRFAALERICRRIYDFRGSISRSAESKLVGSSPGHPCDSRAGADWRFGTCLFHKNRGHCLSG